MSDITRIVRPGNDNAQALGPKADGGKPCPICKKPRVLAYKPFCSKRCCDVDLARWMKGTYAIPVQNNAEEDEEV